MKKRLIALGILFIFFVVFFVYISTVPKKNTTSVIIAIPENDKVENYNTNYYTHWLEEETGYDIQFEMIPTGYEKEYIETMLTSKNSEIDGVFLSGDEDYLTVEELNAYGRNGLITNIRDYMAEDSNLYKMLDEYEDYGIYEKMERGGAFYYYPNVDTARKSRNLQVFWINADWLKALNLPIPQTTEELYKTLQAFKEKDPNGNGKRDELPLISCEENVSLESYHYLLNAFAYDDPLHGGFKKNDKGELVCESGSDNYREGLAYCNRLYCDGLLTDTCFSYTSKQLKELVNSPEDLVGAFTCKSIADVIYPNFPDVLAKYIHVPPLGSADGTRNAVWLDYEPKIGGYIPSNSSHVKEVLEIMDKMLSEEGALISEFGERDVDFKDSEKSDLSIYGNKAYITTINYLGDRTQNKNYAGVGPQFLKDIYANGVTWNGDNSLVEYNDVRAVNLYESYYIPEDKRPMEPYHDSTDYKELLSYEEDMTRRFITGEEDIGDDKCWERYVDTIKAKAKSLGVKVVKK